MYSPKNYGDKMSDNISKKLFWEAYVFNLKLKIAALEGRLKEKNKIIRQLKKNKTSRLSEKQMLNNIGLSDFAC